MLKSCGWGGVGGGGGPCDYCVIPSPFGLDFGTLDFGTSDLGLTIRILSRHAVVEEKLSNNYMSQKIKQLSHNYMLNEDKRGPKQIREIILMVILLLVFCSRFLYIVLILRRRLFKPSSCLVQVLKCWYAISA